MSQQYPGGLITKNPVVPSGPYQNSTASGVWTMDQAAQYVKAGNWPTSGNIDPSLFIENLFSTYLYTGNGSTQTITNGIDLSGKGGLVWMKGRSGATDHALYDTARGATKDLVSNSSAAETTQATGLTAFSGTGFSIGALAKLNTNAATYVSWTFREQAKFFDIVTYTGNGANRTIAHNLGSVPGCIIIKSISGTANWYVYHRSYGNTGSGQLNTTNAFFADATSWNNTTPTSSVFSLGTNGNVNTNGVTYVAYLFAHNAGGFGLSGTDNVISCGSFTTNSGGSASITLGYEPQWMLVKAASTTSNWEIYDNMRGWSVAGDDVGLFANTSGAENPNIDAGSLTATGVLNFTGLTGALDATYIYIAIRRGPMKVPTSGTSVFSPNTSSSPAGTVITTGFPLDASLTALRAGGYGNVFLDRLRGFQTIPYGTTVNSAYLVTNTTGVEQSLGGYSAGVNNTGFQIPNTWADLSTIYYSFRRAPGFFDVVCYTGTGVARTINHNLAAVPELMIVKKRSGGLARGWFVYSSPLTAAYYTVVNTAAATVNGGTFPWNNTVPTSSVFSVSNDDEVNGASNTYVAYLFATVAGVSKVGSYTGTGTTNQINCGFTTGARFVLIKRTNSTGDWYVWDSARGIVAGNDPYLLLNSTAAEVTSTDYIDTASTGFEISSTAPAAINANGGSFIFLAIA